MKRIFNIFIAAFLLCLTVGCEQEGFNVLSEIQVSPSYVSIDVNGGSATIELTANDAWTVDAASVPAWLTVAPMSGSAGQTKLTVSAEATKATNNAEFKILCGGKAQVISVIQFAQKTEAPISTAAQVIAGNDGVTYRMKGVCSKYTGTGNDLLYGNWYITDETGTVYIYGTLDKKGATKGNPLAAWGIEVGDIVTIEGPKTTYNGTVELVDVAVISITKSLLKVVGDAEYKVEKGDCTLDVKLAYKGSDIKVNTDACWLTLAGIDVQKDTAYVKLHVAENTEDTRTANVSFTSSLNGQTSEASIAVTQATGLSMYKIPFAEGFQAGQGAFEIKDITPRTDGKAIWSFASGYGMKASAGSKVDTKSMLVSPKISLSGAASPVLTFEHCGKYCGDQAEELTIWASTDGGENWTQLLIPNEHPNNYGWVNSGEISLAKFVGKDYVQLAFQYISNTQFYGTWEVRNVKVEDRALVLTNLAELSNVATSASVDYTVNLKDAIVSYVNGSNAFIQDATGAVQVYSKTHGLTAGTVLNGPVKFTLTLYSGYQEATAIDISGAAKTTGTVAPIVLTVDKLNKDYTRYTCCLVKIEGASFKTGAAGTAKVNDTMTQDGASVSTRTQANAVKYEAGKSYDVVCVPVRYNGNPQVSIYENPIAK